MRNRRKTERTSVDSEDPSFRLLDSVLRRVCFLVMRLGIPLNRVTERLEQIVKETEAEGLGHASVRDSRSFAQVHGGPAIMHDWFNRPEYINEFGQPRPLPITGNEPSFSALVQMAAPQISPDLALKDLLSAGAVQVIAPDIVQPRSKTVIVAGQEARAELGFYAVDNLLTAVSANVEASPVTASFQREATCLRFDPAQLSRVRSQLFQHCEAGINQADEWLNQYALDNREQSRPTSTVVVGTYIAIRDSALGADKE